ncbi:hypothetical protein AB0I49_13355 [Streptomyces sp. NPDC050617]|uniref:hypothetical protein n=1 Tax=Streptomyces sp. NPDC050617 TaxID=3154628 RepID=UPI003430EFAF
MSSTPAAKLRASHLVQYRFRCRSLRARPSDGEEVFVDDTTRKLVAKHAAHSYRGDSSLTFHLRGADDQLVSQAYTTLGQVRRRRNVRGDPHARVAESSGEQDPDHTRADNSDAPVGTAPVTPTSHMRRAPHTNHHSPPRRHFLGRTWGLSVTMPPPLAPEQAGDRGTSLASDLRHEESIVTERDSRRRVPKPVAPMLREFAARLDTNLRPA